MPQRTMIGMAAIMLAHFDSATASERNRGFRASAQDLDSSLNRLGPQVGSIHKL